MNQDIPLLKFDTVGLPIFSPELRAIPIFRKIVERNRGSAGDADGRKKKQNVKELAFIHLYTHFQLQPGKINPYYKYGDEDKLDKLKHDLEFETSWKIDDDLQAAIELYREREVKSFDMEFLDDVMIAARQTKDYFRNVDYDRRDAKGNLLYKPLDVMRAMAQVSTTINELDMLRERIMNQQKASVARVRGGGEVGSRETPKR